MKFETKYLVKTIIIAIILIINIIAIIGVATTVGNALNELKYDINNGKISKQAYITESNENSKTIDYEQTSSETSDYEQADDMEDLDFGNLFNILLKSNSNVFINIILIILIAAGLSLIILGIYILFKLK